MILNLENILLVDTIVLVLGVYICLMGYKKGVLAQIVRMLCTIFSVYLIFRFYTPLVEWLEANSFKQVWIWILGIIIVTRVGLFCIFRLIYPSRKKGILPFFDHIVGLLFGIIEVSFLLSFWVSICQTRLVKNGQTYLDNSAIKPIYTSVQKGVIHGLTEK